MDQVARDWYELRFELDFMRSRGTDFQDLFAKLMGLRHPGDFTKVRAAGPLGDLKNDGYLASERTIFQCYGPDEMDARGIRKMREDFRGAKLYWPMDRWIYVHNHPQGVTGALLKAAHVLERDEGGGIQIKIWSLEELRHEVFQLAEPELRVLLGPAPARRDVIGLRFDAIEPLLAALAGQPTATTGRISPPSSQKLDHNRLSPAAKRLLLLGMEGAAQVREFLARWPDPTFGDQVAAAFNERYLALRDQGLSPDRILSELQSFTSGDAIPEPEEQAASLSVLAYLFERCDIFEDVAVRTGQ